MLEPPDCSRAKPSETIFEPGRVVLVGGRRQMRRLSRREQLRESWARLPYVGYVDVWGRNRQFVVHPKSEPLPMLGRIERLSEVVDRTRATDVVVALARPLSRKLREQLRRLSTSGRNVQIHWIGEGGDATIAPSPGQFGAGSAVLPWSLLWQRTAKRAVDIVGSAIGLLLLSPILLTVALAILLTSGRPIFYTQQRVGQRGRRFHIWKFRSMRTDAEQATGPIWAEDHDRRCTRIGDWLRHTNIDELPQLWNVLCGDMSLVGPRPERPCFVDEFNAQHSDYDLRHAVPSGLTGWAQVHGWRGKTSLRKRIQYDLDYINRWSFWIDLKILLMTIEHVVFGKTNWAPRKTEK